MTSVILATVLFHSAFLPIPELRAPNLTKPSQNEMIITILYDNYASDERLATGWGFAALLETGSHTLLFDTGADGDALLENMRILGKDPRALEAVVISHAHGDHTGGLQALFDLGLRPRLYVLAAFPHAFRQELAGLTQVLEASPGLEIIPGVFTTGQVGEAIPEQAVVLETPEGAVVLTGCAHPGAVQMAEAAQAVVSGPLHGVLGGFHLMQAQADDIRAVIRRFHEMGVAVAGPTHCSGELAMDLFRESYGQDFVLLGSGRVVRFSGG